MRTQTAFSLSPEALKILKRKVAPRYRSSYVSTLIVAQQVREDTQAQYEKMRTREQWDQDGVCVD
jgi:hypothetical protein